MASSSYRYPCGVPGNQCSGSVAHLPKLLSAAVPKAHSSRIEAFKCHRAWLISQGYQQVGSREFQLGGGPIRVLTKPSRFGARLRGGKRGEQGGAGGNRHTPDGHGGGLISTY